MSVILLDYTFQTSSPFIDTSINELLRQRTPDTTRQQLPVSAVPQFQTVIAIHSLLQGSPRCIFLLAKSNARYRWLFSLHGLWKCETARHPAAAARCLNSFQVYGALIVNIIISFFNRTIWHNLSLMYAENFQIRLKHLKDTSKNVKCLRFSAQAVDVNKYFFCAVYTCRIYTVIFVVAFRWSLLWCSFTFSSFYSTAVRRICIMYQL